MWKNFNLESNLTCNSYLSVTKFSEIYFLKNIPICSLISCHIFTLFNKQTQWLCYNSSKFEKSWVPVHSQWVPVKKRKCLGFCVTRQLTWRQTRKFFITVYWKKYSPSIHLKHKKDWNKYASLNNSHRNHTNRIFYQKIFKSINHSKAVL